MKHPCTQHFLPYSSLSSMRVALDLTLKGLAPQVLYGFYSLHIFSLNEIPRFIFGIKNLKIKFHCSTCITFSHQSLLPVFHVSCQLSTTTYCLFNTVTYEGFLSGLPKIVSPHSQHAKRSSNSRLLVNVPAECEQLLVVECPTVCHCYLIAVSQELCNSSLTSQTRKANQKLKRLFQDSKGWEDEQAQPTPSALHFSRCAE